MLLFMDIDGFQFRPSEYNHQKSKKQTKPEKQTGDLNFGMRKKQTCQL